MAELLISELSKNIRESIPTGISFDFIPPEELSSKTLLDSEYKLILLSLSIETPDPIQISRMSPDSRIFLVPVVEDTFRLYLCREAGIKTISIEMLKPEFIGSLIEDNRSRDIGSGYSKKSFLIDNAFLESTLNPDDFSGSIKSIFCALSLISKYDIIILILNVGRETLLYSEFDSSVKRNNYDIFLKFCYHNHYDSIPGDSPTTSKQIFLNNYDNSSFDELLLNNRAISSYFSSPLYNESGEVFGTIHLGNFINNYFNNDILRGQLLETFYMVGSILAKNIKYSNAISDKREIRTIFSKFVPDKIIDRDLRLGKIEKTGELKRVAILFTDIRSFTTISENNSADLVVSFLNNYFNIMVKCIKEQGGVIDKFIGDAIVAIFGAPDSLDNPSQSAVDAAINMIKELPNVKTDSLILPPEGFAIGIGLHIGESIVGNIGSDDKMSYTSIGDVITVAEELEGLTKKYKKPILLTSSIKSDISNRGKFVDTISIEGEDVTIYTVL